MLKGSGRLRQRYSRVERYYDIRLEEDAASGNAKTLVWTRTIPTEDTPLGVYCLRTNQADWDESTLLNTYLTRRPDPEGWLRQAATPC